MSDTIRKAQRRTRAATGVRYHVLTIESLRELRRRGVGDFFIWEGEDLRSLLAAALEKMAEKKDA